MKKIREPGFKSFRRVFRSEGLTYTLILEINGKVFFSVFGPAYFHSDKLAVLHKNQSVNRYGEKEMEFGDFKRIINWRAVPIQSRVA